MEQPTGKLQGKRGRGRRIIGRRPGIARELSAAGAQVVLAARRLDRLEQAAAESRGRRSACGVTSPSRAPATAVVAQAVDTLGGLDVVVYASGTTAFSTIETATAEGCGRDVRHQRDRRGLVLGAAVPHPGASEGHANITFVGVRHVPLTMARATGPTSRARAAEAILESLQIEAPEGRVHDPGRRPDRVGVRPRPGRLDGPVRVRVVRARPDR